MAAFMSTERMVEKSTPNALFSLERGVCLVSKNWQTLHHFVLVWLRSLATNNIYLSPNCVNKGNTRQVTCVLLWITFQMVCIISVIVLTADGISELSSSIQITPKHCRPQIKRFLYQGMWTPDRLIPHITAIFLNQFHAGFPEDPHWCLGTHPHLQPSY